MFYDFAHRHTACTVDEMPDKVILSRDQKGTTVREKEYVYNGLFSSSSAVQNGSKVEATRSLYLVKSMRNTVESDKYCSLIKTNAVVDVQRYSRQYDDKYNPIGMTFIPVEAAIPSYAEYVSAQLRQQEPGLLPTTAYVLLLQINIDVRKPQDPGLISPDRIILDGRPYQVDVVDRIKYPNLLHVQLSEDLR